MGSPYHGLVTPNSVDSWNSLHSFDENTDIMGVSMSPFKMDNFDFTNDSEITKFHDTYEKIRKIG